MQITFWGVRGSIPVPGPTTLQVGGNTSCVEVRIPHEFDETRPDRLIIFDAGTGIRELGAHLMASGQKTIKGHLLLTHLHYDHIQGRPFFIPGFIRKHKFITMGRRQDGDQTLAQILANHINAQYLPFLTDDMKADLRIKDFPAGETLFLNDTKILTADIAHPGGCIGYRVEAQDTAFTYCTDSSHWRMMFTTPLDKIVVEIVTQTPLSEQSSKLLMLLIEMMLPTTMITKPSLAESFEEMAKRLPMKIFDTVSNDVREQIYRIIVSHLKYGFALNQNVKKLAQDTHLLVHDAQFTPERQAQFPDWGHSSWEDAAHVANMVNADALALFHHDPNANDDTVREFVMNAREIFPRTFAAKEGMKLKLPLEELPEW